MDNEIETKLIGKGEAGEEYQVDIDEKVLTKRYYVDYYDMFDGWGLFGFFPERLLDDLRVASKLCDDLNEKLAEGNKQCGEHFGVIDSLTNREIYCGLDEKYKLKIVEKQDKKIDKTVTDKPDSNKSDSYDRYREVAEEIAIIINEDLLDSSDFDKNKIVDVLKRRFDINKEDMGKILTSEITMFNIYSGKTFTIPIFGILAFETIDIRPIIPGKIFPNYNLENKYDGYTENGVFRKIDRWTELLDSAIKNPMLVFASFIAGISVAYIIINI